MNKILNLSKKFYSIHRSITGSGVRKTLRIIKTQLPNLKIKSLPSNKKVYDWKIPDEWNIYDAYIKDKTGKIIDFKVNNLSVVNYSIPIKKIISRKNLFNHLHTIKKPNSIPYVTSYYKKNWGFCLNTMILKNLLETNFL